jgi:hypothetical protein
MLEAQLTTEHLEAVTAAPIPTPQECEGDVPSAPAVAPERSDGDKIRALSQILRVLGAVVLIASASTFLIQRWEGGNDIQRYLTLLAHTAMLSVAGFFCGIGIKESKGARTFLGLVLAEIPIHFGVLGGLLYSRFAWDGMAQQIPSYASWVAPSPGAALLTAASALALLLPLSYVSFLALARSQAKWLTAIYVAVNAALLIPLREPSAIAALVAILVAGLSVHEIRHLRREASLQTVEGGFIRAMLAAPLALMIGRSLQLYDLSAVFVGVLWASGAFLLFAVAPTLTTRPRIRAALQALSAVPAAVAWACFTIAIAEALDLGLLALIPLFTLPYAGILCGMSLLCAGWDAWYRRVAAFTALAGVAAPAVLAPSLASSFLCLVVAVGTLIYGYLVEQKTIFFAGVAAAAFGLLSNLRYAVELYSLSHWGSLALLGIAIVLIASILERNHERLFRRAAALRARLRGWEY